MYYRGKTWHKRKDFVSLGCSTYFIEDNTIKYSSTVVIIYDNTLHPMLTLYIIYLCTIQTVQNHSYNSIR